MTVARHSMVLTTRIAVPARKSRRLIAMLNPPTAEPMNALPRPKVPEPGLKFMMRPGARDCRATTMTRIFLLPSGVARRRSVMN